MAPRMHAFAPAHEVALTLGYVLYLKAAGDDGSGMLTADLQLWNGAPKLGQRLRLGHAQEQRSFVRSALAVAPTLTEAELIAALGHLSATVPPALAAARAAAPASTEGAAATGPYIVHAGRICTVQYDDDGQPRHKPLCNFDARIVAEVITDDGAEQRGAFEIEGTLADGRSLGTVRVPFPQFPGMAWPIASWGGRAIVSAGQGTRDYLREAIQLLSGEIPRRRVYEHTGWRRLDGVLVYLSATGAIGAAGVVEGIEVELTGAAARVALPAPPEGDELRAAVEASLALWRLLPVPVAAALHGAAFLAPLREFLGSAPPDLTVWLHGQSGTFKSEVSALEQAHFGPDFTRTTLATFTATANAIERMTFTFKDALCVIDDYHPAQDYREAQAMASVASRLLRGVGNGSGRPRMNADTRLRPDLPPRCVPLASGERLPQGHSTAARLVPVPVEHGNIDPVALTRVQADRALLSQAMAGYIRWLAADADRLGRTVPELFRRYRTEAQGHGSHTREPAQVAYLFLGVDQFLAFAQHAGAITSDEHGQMRDAAWSALLDLAASAGDALASETPVQRFLSLLGDGIASRRVYLEDLEGGAPDVPEAWGWERHSWTDANGDEQQEYRHAAAQLLGRVDEHWLYLLPEAAYGYVAAAARTAGEVFPVELKTLLKRLDEAKLIATVTEGDRVRRTLNVWSGGRTHRYIKLKRSALRPPGAESGELGEGGEETARVSSILPHTPSPKPSSAPFMEKEKGEGASSGTAPLPPIPRIPHSSTPRETPAQDRTEAADLFLTTAEAAGYPRLPYKPGHTIPVGEDSYRRFAAHLATSADDLRRAAAALAAAEAA